MRSVKIIAIIFVIILVINIILRTFNLIDDLVFWVIIILGAIVSYMIKSMDKD